MTKLPSRGEIWRVDFEPVTGHEQGATRPALIVSSDVLNHGPSGLVTVIPVTTKGRPLRSYLQIMPPEGGLTQTSFVICDQVRTISSQRLGKCFGSVSAETMQQVAIRLRFLLDID
ncbi:MAG: type II toxin-antitoxin system PemK/MazF family toxin [Tepidisphaeraceae bacterium]|jgi:mRNA interferase MazF